MEDFEYKFLARPAKQKKNPADNREIKKFLALTKSSMHPPFPLHIPVPQKSNGPPLIHLRFCVQILLTVYLACLASAIGLYKLINYISTPSMFHMSSFFNGQDSSPGCCKTISHSYNAPFHCELISQAFSLLFYSLNFAEYFHRSFHRFFTLLLSKKHFYRFFSQVFHSVTLQSFFTAFLLCYSS